MFQVDVSISVKVLRWEKLGKTQEEKSEVPDVDREEGRVGWGMRGSADYRAACSPQPGVWVSF